jgi:two-component system, chemotaxis family, CheB/CheR fusion protein
MPVVGMVASAGGLDAFRRFFQKMPARSGIAFILVPHLDPRRESLMVQLIGKQTAMPVQEALEGTRLEPDRVYLIPPKSSLSVREGVLHLGPRTTAAGDTPIDPFLRSLADDQREAAVCVILSGTGSHGSLGLKAIKGNGGMAMVQDPVTAEYDQMPQNAIATGLADHVLPVEEMPRALLDYVRTFLTGMDIEAQGAPEAVMPILSLLRARTKLDFRAYRKPMLLRRLARRMGLRHIDKLTDYLTMLRTDTVEQQHLLRDLLISVTSFFRDEGLFRVLETQVVPELLRNHSADDPLRAWVVGCATGEEAYSLAMLLIEQASAADVACAVQVFATDIDQDALHVARRGVYPAAIAGDVSAERLKRFFVRSEEGGWQVGRQLRDAVLFAPHNALSDAPFSRLDLVSCRNLLIYLEPEIQHKLLAVLHFALNAGGCLALGTSESLGEQTDMFEVVSRTWRVYRRRAASTRPPVEIPIVSARGAHRFQQVALSTKQSSLGEITRNMLVQQFGPAAVVVNPQLQAQHFAGPTHLYLRQPSGAPTNQLLALVAGGLRTRVREVTQKALRDGVTVSASSGRVKRGREQVEVRVTAQPLRAAHVPGGTLLVAFEEVVGPRSARGAKGHVADEALVDQLEGELKVSRDDLQSAVEELESTNEELKASNEEVMSMNEELQSANEELETSKEELQSMNEELVTVNSQLSEKVIELEEANDDMANLLASTDLAVLYLDADRKIRRFTPAATHFFNLICTDIGRPISDISGRNLDPDLEGDIQSVLQTLAPAVRDIRDRDERWYLRRVTAYQTGEHRVAGVVITYIEVTPLKRAESSLREATEKLEARVAQRTEDLRQEMERHRGTADALRSERTYNNIVIENTAAGVFALDRDGKFLRANRGCVVVTGYGIDELVGKPVSGLLAAADVARFERVIAGLLAHGPPQTGEFTWVTKEGAERRVACTLSGLLDQDGAPDCVLGSALDVTAIRDLEASVRAESDLVNAVLESAPVLLVVRDAAGRILRFNHFAERLSGIESREAIGRTLWELVLTPEDAAVAKTLFAEALAGVSTGPRELNWRHRDGSTHTIAWRAMRSLGPDGSPRVVATGLDITEQRLSELQARKRLDELAALYRIHTANELAATLAHELNQPLSAISSFSDATLQMLESGSYTPEPVISNLKKIAEQSLRAGRFISELRRFVAQGEIERTSVDLNSLVRSACTLAGPLAHRHNVRIRLGLAEALPPLKVADIQIEHVITNLLRNAVEAIREAGLRAGEVRVSTSAIPENMARVTVVDNGPGLPADKIERLFEPFFTTKADGLGMGLRISRTIVEAHGGKLWAEFGPGGVFSFTLPFAT